MKNMSFSMCPDAILNRTKTVTRRLAWWDLKPGDVLQAVEKGMGLKKGEKVKRLGLIRVVSVREEQLIRLTAVPSTIAQAEMQAEGFPTYTPTGFIEMFCKANGCTPYTVVNRIEFEYVDEEGTDE